MTVNQSVNTLAQYTSAAHWLRRKTLQKAGWLIFLLGFSHTLSAACRDDLFANGAQVHAFSGVVQFGYNAKLVDGAGTSLQSPTVVSHPDSTQLSCGAQVCTAAGAPVAYQQLEPFKLSESGVDVTVPYQASGELGLFAQRQYRAVNLEAESTLSIDGESHEAGDQYLIDSLSIGNKATLQLRAGRYWVRNLSMEAESSIAVVGEGTVTLHVLDSFSPGWLASINMDAFAQPLSSDHFVLIAYGNTSFNTNLVSAFVYGVGDVSVGTSSKIYGAVTAKTVALQDFAEIHHSVLASNTDIGALCASQAGPDQDADGVSDSNDSCPNSPPQAPVNVNGCGASQLDSDGDSVSNSADLCPNSLPGVSVNEFGCSEQHVENCRTSLLADGLQAHGSPAEIRFGYNASIQNNPDHWLNSGLVSGQEGTQVASCGSQACASVNAPATAHELLPFQFSNSSDALFIESYASGTLGVNGLKHFGSVTVGMSSTLNIDEVNHDNSAVYFIDQLHIDYQAKWDVRPGTYWIRQLTIASEAQINVIGDGTVRLYVRDALTVPYNASVNQVAGQMGDPNQLLLVAYNNLVFDNNKISAFVVAAGDASLGYQFELKGALLAANVVTNSEATVHYFAPALTADMGQICSGDIGDADGDGVVDIADQCPDTEIGDAVDVNGCSDAQRDSDGDGVTDLLDAFPFDPNETKDSDSDGIGDNADIDRDGDWIENDQDAFPDDPTEWSDLDGDGFGDNSDLDRDGDGISNELDVFPYDGSEWADLDADGVGDNSDPDKDGDGVNNSDDVFPLDASESSDIDGDGIGDNADTDRDGDGYENENDAFPNDASEWSDLDGDGIGDNTDADKDGDGVTNEEDAFPEDSSESSDLDGDGIGDNGDTDRDGDSVANEDDVFPNDPTESHDLDGDGIGDNADPDRDGDGVNNEEDAFPDDGTKWGTDASVRITSPSSLTTVGVSPVVVTGTVFPLNAQLTLNGIDVEHENGEFSASVALKEGHNVIVARAVSAENQVTDAISLSLDKTPPYITVESHQEGEVVSSNTITVTGLINDIVRGTVEQTQASVSVNGIPAIISNRSYAAVDVPVQEGDNVLLVTAVDQVGNSASKQLNVRYVIPQSNIIELVGGQFQSAPITTVLPQSLQVRLMKDGVPVIDETVVFRVIQGSGSVGIGSAMEGRATLVKTNDEGMASTSFMLGLRAGTANHKVKAAAVGFENEIIFNASATGQPGNKISVNSGNNQRGVAGNVLPEPLVTVVTDAGANVVAGARVNYVVTKGSSTFVNGEASYEVITDSDGRASAELLLGSEEGLDEQRVTAFLMDVENNSISAGFMATSFVPKDPGLTTISGTVLDNQDNPIPGVTVRVDGTTREAVSNESGAFVIQQAPIGPVHLVADGSTAAVEGEFPDLSFNLVTISGVDNPLSAPIYMVKLDKDNAVLAGTQDVSLELPGYPGFKLDIQKGSVTFPDGSREGMVSVTQVNASKVPMAPPNGMQPQLIVTIQPTGTLFDPPARLTLPNVDSHSPGAQVEMYSYDHDLEEFVSIGLGTVSEDGSLITSNPGVGVVKAGWHCGSQPGGQGCAHGCQVCQECDGNCNCQPADNDPRIASTDKEGDCKKKECQNGSAVEVNDDEDVPKDAHECAWCVDGELQKFTTEQDCDDGLFCTAHNGVPGGPDKCMDGRCAGDQVEDEVIEEDIVEADLVEGPLSLIQKVTNQFGAKGKLWPNSGAPITVKSQKRYQVLKQCCESSDSFNEINSERSSFIMDIQHAFRGPKAPIPFTFGLVAIRPYGKVTLRFEQQEEKKDSPCDDENKCNETSTTQGGGIVLGGLEAADITEFVITVKGELRAQANAGFVKSCDGPAEGGFCIGPLTGRVSVQTLSFLSYHKDWVLIDAYCGGGYE